LSTISYRELNTRIKKGLFDSAYLFSGQDRDRKNEAIHLVESAVEESCQGSFAVIRIRTDETSSEQFAANLLAVPLFEKCRMIVIPGVEELEKASKDILLDFIKAPMEGLYLVMCTELAQWEFKKKKKALFGRLQDSVSLVDFSPPRAREMKSRAMEIVRELGFKIGEKALEKLLIKTGNDFSAVRSEMEKLALFVPPGGEVDEEEVDSVVSRGGNVDVWALADAVSHRDEGEAQRILHDLIVSGEKPVQIVGALWYNMVRLAWCRNMLDSGVDAAEIGKRMKLRQWLLKNYLSKALSFNRDEYNTILNILFELDLAVRSRGKDVEAVFSRGIAEMIIGIKGRRGVRTG
jgi:DNA polymerase-3 subunit delta